MPINKSKVSTQHPDYANMLPQWQKGIDCVEGQRAVHDAGETYLPRLKDQTDAEYSAYKLRALFVNYSWRSVSAMVGMMLRKPMIVAVPESIKPLLDDVTMSGVSFYTLAQESAIEIMTTGRDGVLVDYPVEGTEGMTVAMAEAAGIRPIMARYCATSILNWKTQRIGNATVLSMVVLQEEASVPDPENEYAHKTEARYRVLDLAKRMGRLETEYFAYRQRVFRINDKKEDEQVGGDIFPLMNGKPLDRIPFYFIGTLTTTSDVDDPPMIDLFDVNLDHYRLSADHKHGLHFGGLPTAVISGYTPENKGDKLYIGSSSAWVFPDPQATAKYLEFTGQGLKPIAEEMVADEQRMAILGARLLSAEKKATETSQTAQIHRAGESSVLSAIAHTISTGLTMAINTFCAWAGQPGDWSVELNQEFMPPEVTPDELKGWMAAWLAGAPGFSDQGLFALLQKRELIAADVMLEEEQARIAAKPPAKPDVTDDLNG
ncbi:MAG: DUF4055 domain-containing protein [Deltaproteobacteria bacterium]|nr:DUF4055 domain-containing protein [Deltaproteobacteria bacterium]